MILYTTTCLPKLSESYLHYISYCISQTTGLITFFFPFLKKISGFFSLLNQTGFQMLALTFHRFWFWTLNVNRTLSYEITLVCLSVSLSLCPSLNFPKIGSLVFSDIVHDDSWPWYLVTDKAIFSKKTFGGPNLDPTDQNQAQIRFFPIFLTLDHTFFLKLYTMVACNNV